MTHPSKSPALATEPEASGSAERSLRVLSLLANEGRALSLAEIAASLSLPKGSAHRLCAALETGGFLARDVDERSFIVGPALRRLAFDTLNHGVVRGLRHQILAELVATIGETCNFTTVDGVEVLYLDRVEAQWPLRLTLDVGSHVPLHCTASGKLFLAQMPVPARDALIAQLSLVKMTRNTIVTAKALARECDRIAVDGYACDREEFIDGLIAVAVPIGGREGSDGFSRAAVAVHAPVSRLSLAAAVARLPALRKAAVKLRALL